MHQGNYQGTLTNAGNPAWDGVTAAECSEPVVNVTSGPSGALASRSANFAFAASTGEHWHTEADWILVGRSAC